MRPSDLTTVMFLCCFQVEVTFNFLEIRAMNTYPEHQVTHWSPIFFLLFGHSYQYKVWLWKPVLSIHYRLSSIQTRPPTHWDCRHRTSWITWSATSTTPSLGSSTTPFMRKPHRASLPRAKKQVFLFFYCLCWGAKTSWPTLTALDSALASWQLHFWAAFLFSSQMHSCIAVVCIQLMCHGRL